jgi:LDH2 family malate/lactate/ureidoglycolate dehydrogenase
MIMEKERMLALALALAIAAPNEAKAQECIAMAESIAARGMTLEQVLRAKRMAENMAMGGA